MPYIKELWQGVTLEEYNNWFPLTGKIATIPRGYDKFYENVNEWFTTFALRAQNDIDAYLNFPFSRFPFHIFVDEDLKLIVRDCVFVLIEHWLFNRIPVEFFTGSSARVRSGTEYNAPLVNMGLQPARMKLWAQLTTLKKVFQTYNGDLNDIDISQIDLNFFYSKVEVEKKINAVINGGEYILDTDKTNLKGLVPLTDKVNEIDNTIDTLQPIDTLIETIFNSFVEGNNMTIKYDIKTKKVLFNAIADYRTSITSLNFKDQNNTKLFPKLIDILDEEKMKQKLDKLATSIIDLLQYLLDYSKLLL